MALPTHGFRRGGSGSFSKFVAGLNDAMLLVLVVLLFPVIILLVGAPIALMVRASSRLPTGSKDLHEGVTRMSAPIAAVKFRRSRSHGAGSMSYRGMRLIRSRGHLLRSGRDLLTIGAGAPTVAPTTSNTSRDSLSV